MKSRVLILLAVLAVSGLPAEAADVLRGMVINDSFTFGLVSNPDDLRSYGLAGTASISDAWRISLLASGITNRYDDQEDARGRYDEFILAVSSPLETELYQLRLSVMPHFGAAGSGDFGFFFGQKVLHDTFGLIDVVAPYEDPGKFSVTPYGRLQAELSLPVYRGTAELDLAAAAEGAYAPGYMAEAYGGGYLEVRRGNPLSARLSFGYRHREVLDDSPAQAYLGRYETGREASLEKRVGLTAFSYRWNLDTLHGWGGIGIDASITEQFVPWEGSDLVISYGLLHPFFGLYSHIRYRFTPELGLYLGNTYGSSPAEEQKRYRENRTLWMAGADYEFSGLSGILRPVLALSGGVRHLRLIEYPQSSMGEHLMDVTRFAAELTAGVRFPQEGQIQLDGISYGLELLGGVQYTADAQDFNEFQAAAISEVSTVSPVMRLGLTAGLSLK